MSIFIRPHHADFRRDNGDGIHAACRSFVRFCKELNMVGGALVAIDGSKFKAAGSRDQIINAKRLEEDQRRIDKSIKRYLQRLEEADREDTNEPTLDKERVEAALEELKKRKVKTEKRAHKLKEQGGNQYCITEPEAKVMRSGRDGMILAYNVQSAVDAKAKLIVHHEVTTEANDSQQLAPMARATQAVIEASNFTVLADAGYSNGEQLAECERSGIAPIVPANRAINNQGDYFQKEAFNYDTKLDCYVCPQGEHLNYKTYSSEAKLRLYTTESCSNCPLKSRCTKGKQRWVSRHFNEDTFARVEARLASQTHLMRQRSGIVEAPFGTIKWMMRNGRFLCKGLKAVKTEMALSVLAYNLKRMINTIGIEGLISCLA